MSGIGLQGFLIVLDRVGLFVFPCEQLAPRHPGFGVLGVCFDGGRDRHRRRP